MTLERRTLGGGALFAFLALPLVPGTALAQLKELETDEFRLIHPGGTESFVIPHVARTFANSMRFQRQLFAFEPREKVNLLLLDFSDSGNASAGAVPRDGVTIQLAPLSYAFETMTSNERMNTYMNHELVHVATMDGPGPSDRFFRRVFSGKVNPVAEQPESILYLYLTAPRVAVPRWYLEGSAVFVETWMAGGIGRAQGAYDEMVFRAMVRDGSRFYSPLGLVSEGTKVDFQLSANAYLYGTRFVTWLALERSPAKVVEWLSRRDGSKAYFASQFERVFGTGLETAWAEWITFERGFQEANLAAIRRYPTTVHHDVSKRALGSVSRAWLDPERRRLYAALNYPGQVSHLGAISLDDGSVERLVNMKGPVMYTVSSVAYEPRSRTIFYTTDNNAFRDLVALDPDTKKTRVLMKDARIGDLAYDPADRSLWGIRHLNGICTLVRIPHPWTEWKQVHSWPYGPVAYDLDVSPDGSLVSVSVGEVTGQHSLRVFRTDALGKGDATPQAKFDFGTAIPSNFVFSPDGRYLYGSSYYTGVSNIFRFEIATGKLDAVTNAETGYFRPLPEGGDSLVAFRYTGEGFVPTRIEAKPVEDVSAITFLGERLVEKRPELKDWNVGSPSKVSFEAMRKTEKAYGLFRSLRLESAYPIAQGYKDYGAVGVRVNLSDPVQLNRAVLAASYTPDGDLPADERLHLRGEYRRYDWNARFWYNDADFYDLVGPTKVSRKGYSVGGGWEHTLVWDDPRRMDLKLDASFSGNLDQLPLYQNVPVDVNELFTLFARLESSYVRNSLGYVDEETGRKWSLVFRGDYVDGKAVPKLFGTVDLGRALPLGHSSLWLRSAAGYSTRGRDDPFANFYFGGFGNNWLDRGSEKRYREFYSFPGLDLNEVGGRNFAKSILEWNLPPVRFRSVGKPGAYLTWARPAVFTTLLATDLDDAAYRRYVGNVGGQVDLRFTVLSALDMTLSTGYAVAFEDGRRPQREFMVSLKVLR
jgi:hypothetical protein